MAGRMRELLGHVLMNIRVLNKHHGAKGEYIGRGSPLGNPFPITLLASREQVIRQYRDWLEQQIELKNWTVINELDRLAEIAQQGDLNLVCFCAPKPCHGDVIKQLLIDAIGNQ